MEFTQLRERALAVRQLYRAYEQQHFGRAWQAKEIALGFVGDVGDLAKLVLALDGVRAIPDAHNKLAHELADCLWVILVLAQMYDIDLERSFLDTMTQLETSIQTKINPEE
jgi:NTP pyrophosphatase (non-canonical NTP hydrolase)